MKNTELLNIKNEFSITNEILENIKKPFFPLADNYLEELPKILDILEKGKDETNIDKVLVGKAVEVKKVIAKIRTATGKLKDSEKDEYKKMGNAIQACHNVIVKTIEEKEAELEKIIKYAENKEKERVANLQKEREEKLKPYITDLFDLVNLGEMEEDRFEAYFLGKKSIFEENQKELKRLEDERIENERIAEEKRIEEIKKQAKIDAEAEIFKKEILPEVRINPIRGNKERLEKEKAYIAYRDSIQFDKFEKEDGKIVFYKKVGEFIF